VTPASRATRYQPVLHVTTITTGPTAVAVETSGMERTAGHALPTLRRKTVGTVFLGTISTHIVQSVCSIELVRDVRHVRYSILETAVTTASLTTSAPRTVVTIAPIITRTTPTAIYASIHLTDQLANAHQTGIALRSAVNALSSLLERTVWSVGGTISALRVAVRRAR
jgi:hypothetical protein